MKYEFLKTDDILDKWVEYKGPCADGVSKVFLFPNGNQVVVMRHSETGCKDHNLFEVVCGKHGPDFMNASTHVCDCTDIMAIALLAKYAYEPISVSDGDYVKFREDIMPGNTYGGLTLLDGEMFDCIPSDRVVKIERSVLPDVFSFKASPYFYSTEMLEKNLGKI